MAIETGRFGEFDNKVYDDAGLRSFRSHPLKFIDWFHDDGVLDIVMSFGYNVNSKLTELIENWEARRHEEEFDSLQVFDYNLDYSITAKRDFWSVSLLRKALFRQTYAIRYPRARYHRYEPSVEKALQDIEYFVSEGLTSGGITEPKGYSSGEIVYSAIELLKELKRKGYPIPDELIEAKKNGDWATTETLLRQCHERMKEFIGSGGKPSCAAESSLKCFSYRGTYAQQSVRGADPAGD